MLHIIIQYILVYKYIVLSFMVFDGCMHTKKPNEMEWFSCVWPHYICSCATTHCRHTICTYILISTHSMQCIQWWKWPTCIIATTTLKWSKPANNGMVCLASHLSIIQICPWPLHALLEAGLCWFVQVLHCNNVTSHAP